MATKSNTKNDDLKSYTKLGIIYNAIVNKANKAVIENLLQKEGDINRITDGHTILPKILEAALDKDSQILNLLLDSGANFTHADEEGSTAVHKAIVEHDLLRYQSKQLKSMDLIMKAHVNFNNTSNPMDKNGISHLHGACMTNNVAAVKLFLKNGADVNQAVNADSPKFASYTALHFAIEFTCPNVMLILMQYGAKVTLKNEAGLSPLHLVFMRKIENSDGEIEKQLKKILYLFPLYVIYCKKTRMHEVDDLGFSKLHVAAIHKDQSLVRAVLKQNVDVNQCVNLDSPIFPGYSALHFAAYSNVRTFEQLLQSGADIEAKNARGETPLDLCLQNYTAKDILSVIMRRGDWSNIVMSNGSTKLIDVAGAMASELEYESFISQRNCGIFIPLDSALWPGYTLLHLAVIFTNSGMRDRYGLFDHKDEYAKIRACLKCGNELTAQDARGSSALHLAFYLQKHRLVRYLLDAHKKQLKKMIEPILDWRQRRRLKHSAGPFQSLSNLANCPQSPFYIRYPSGNQDNKQNEDPTNNQNLSHFHIACLTRHAKAVEYFLFIGTDCNIPIVSACTSLAPTEFHLMDGFFVSSGMTGLHMSVAISDGQISRLLLDRGADVNAQDVNGFTPVHRLMFSKKSHIFDDTHIKSILSAKNLKNLTSLCGLSHLHVACFYGMSDVVRKLLQLDEADVNAKINCKCNSSLSDKYIYKENQVYVYGRPREPVCLLSKYAGYTPLHFTSNWPIKLLLIENNADVFAKNHQGVFPLQTILEDASTASKYTAAVLSNPAVRKHLNDNFGITTLHISCHDPNGQPMRKLLPDKTNGLTAQVSHHSSIWPNFTPLHCAMRRACLYKLQDSNVTSLRGYGNAQKSLYEFLVSVAHVIFKMLFANLTHHNINPKDNHGLSLFHIASMTINRFAIKQFLNHGVDVNQAIGPFSKILAGCTALHLLLKFHCRRKIGRDNFLIALDMLLEKDVNVNAADAYGDTPLFHAAQLTESRELILQQLISKGADVYATNAQGDTAFSLLLKAGNVTWPEIELFLNAGLDFNSYQPVTREGYLALFLHYNDHREIPLILTKYNVFCRIIGQTRMIANDASRRTAMHNVISIELHNDPGILIRSNDVRCISKNTCREVGEEFFGQIIEKLSTQGCDVDHQDIEGKTPLHYAVTFRNYTAFVQLLKFGADINIIDSAGKTAFAYYEERGEPRFINDSARIDDSKMKQAFALHVQKLMYCEQRVNEQNTKLQLKALEGQDPIRPLMRELHKEIEKSKTIKFGNSSLSLYDFLIDANAEITYRQMTIDKRRDVNEIFENILKYDHFTEIDGLLNLKYRASVEKITLIEPAIEAMDEILQHLIPEECFISIFRFLTNGDLRRIIAAAT